MEMGVHTEVCFPSLVFLTASDFIAWNTCWYCILSVPAGCLSIVLLLLTLPTGFPNHGLVSSPVEKLSWKLHRKVDFVGAGLLLSGSIFLVSALQEAANGRAWSSPLVVILLVFCGPIWTSFLGWEWFLTTHKHTQEPVLPWYFLTSRIRLGLIMWVFGDTQEHTHNTQLIIMKIKAYQDSNTFLLGMPFFTCLIQIPQRFQDINGTSALAAGVRLLPFTVFSPLASALAGILTGKLKVSPILVLVVGGIFQTIGLSLMSTLSGSKDIATSQYGFQIITGFGFGLNFATLTLMTPPAIEEKDLGRYPWSPSLFNDLMFVIAVATAAVIQFRLMGGAIGLAIVTTVFNGLVRPKLEHILSFAQLEDLLQSTAVIESFQPELQSRVRNIFAEGFNVQMRIMIGFGAAQIPAALLLWRKKLKTEEWYDGFEEG